jgi:hypothetical protein
MNLQIALLLQLTLSILDLMMPITRYLLDSMVLTICVVTMVFMIPLVDLPCEYIESLLFGTTDAKPTAPFSWSFGPQHLDDLETSIQTQAHLPLYQEKDSSDSTDTATAEHTCTQQKQQASTSLLQPPDLYTITWFCIGFDISRARGKFDHIIIVNRDIGNVCVMCCLLIVMIPKGKVEGRVVRMLLKQVGKLMQRWGWYEKSTAEGEVEGIEETMTEMKVKTEVNKEEKVLEDV